MKLIELKRVEHSFKQKDKCPDIAPNIKEDCILLEGCKPIGFFVKKPSQKILSCAEFCNAELLSSRVPKSVMSRGTGEKGDVKQFSCIIGGVPARPQARRPYPQTSSVHLKPSAHSFIRGMKALAVLCEELMGELMPEQLKKQRLLIEQRSKPEFRFSSCFTSSISNFNISADFHRDAKNIIETVNVIITKRKNSFGGNLYVPDYDACFDQVDGSILVYPAWKSLHAVTPIKPTRVGGFRNSLVFYPLACFGDKND
jgi:hypothetical protein